MKIRKVVLSMTWLCVLALLVLPVTLTAQPPEGQTPSETPPEMPSDVPPEMQAMMEAWQKAMTPGEPHEHLAEAAGTWKLTMKMWMDPAGEPEINEGTAEREMILGGRYLQEVVTGTVMGMPFEGHSLTGYDNTTGQYWGTWVDNLSTGLMTMKGERDGDRFIWHAEATDPMTGGTAEMKIVITSESPDREVSEFFEKRGDEEVKTMEIVYERQ
jgi:hypothetical protein